MNLAYGFNFVLANLSGTLFQLNEMSRTLPRVKHYYTWGRISLLICYLYTAQFSLHVLSYNAYIICQ